MRRSYRQFCGVARALDLVGERWTLLLVRNLLLGPRRYSDLLTGLPGLTTNLLAARLQELEAAGLVERKDAALYSLTESGAALEPVVMELGRWGGRFMDAPRKTDNVDPGWALLSLKRRYRGGEKGVLGLRVGPKDFELVFEAQRLTVQQRPAIRPDASATLAGMPMLRQLLMGPAPATRDLGFEGDEAIARRLLGSLGLVLPREKGDRLLLATFRSQSNRTHRPSGPEK